MYTLSSALRYHRPAIFLSRLISRRWMHRLRNIFALISLLLGMFLVVSTAIPSYSSYSQYILGTLLIFIALWIEQLLLYSYHNHYYYFGLRSILGLQKSDTGVSYEVAEALLGHEKDIARGFATSSLGQAALMRAGLTPDNIAIYLGSESGRVPLTTDGVSLDPNSTTTLILIGTYLLQNDQYLLHTFKSNGIQPEHFVGALNWVVRSHHSQKRKSQWWSKDMLSHTQGIGRDFTFGHTYHLEKFTKNLYSSAVFSNVISDHESIRPYVDELEESLTRNQAANALIIGKSGVGKIDIVIALEERIKNAEALASITDLKFVTLNTELLFATSQSKPEFEQMFLTLLTEALQAGNIVLVIEHVSILIREGEALDVFIPELIEPYLAHPGLHIIALDTPENFHNVLERAGGFLRHFDEIMIEESGLEGTMSILRSIAPLHENNGLFTHPALEAITTGAERYLVDGVMPDKAIALMNDISLRTPPANIYSPDFVYSVIADKTGMPIGPISESEKDALLHLEETLHTRIIGQHAALSAIAKTMRRARAGIVNSERPLGSFLFLGPTGVGKTETAKALAQVFFGNEENMTRLDMSEFSTEDRIGHLIGNPEENGMLPALLQEHPYTVLLVDEFEKAHPKVHDLFLQILDEGLFTSGHGTQVNVRNVIIIATSNAGSQHILKALQLGTDINDPNFSKELLQTIIADGVFRPELVNRFDNTIVFNPLSKNEQYAVAELMLTALKERVATKGYQLSLTPALIATLAERGYDPIFGARPMQRVIQDTIEEAIAQKIISGAVQIGDTITLDIPDISNYVNA